MQKTENNLTQKLFENGFISQTQFGEIKSYREKNLFSIRNEIRFLLFLSITMFTSGCGIFIYSHIDTIGHLAILSLILIITIASYYYSFKMAPGFSKQAQLSTKVMYDYLVLAANILAGIFIGYLQYLYNVFGSHNDVATVVTTLLYFVGAYYFDHKGVLSLAITGVCAFVGFSASPYGLLHTSFSREPIIANYAIAVSLMFILWAYYAEKQDLKKHFGFSYQCFALHIMGLACISSLFQASWLVYFLVLAIGVFYFIKLAYRVKALHHLVFAFIYGFIGLTIFIGKAFMEMEDFIIVIYLAPFYFGGGIFAFINVLREFKKINK